MSLRDYLHEKAEESRHNETIGYLIIIIGSIFFVGGTIETVVVSENPKWFLFIPYEITEGISSLVGLAFNLVGIVLLALGIALCINYALERSWYIAELHKAQSHEIEKMKERKRKKKIKVK